jgi:hypothetical protein
LWEERSVLSFASAHIAFPPVSLYFFVGATRKMDLNADLHGICGLMRSHIEIRNRSWMKTVYRDCFLGSDAIDFLVTQGLVETRQEAVEMCNKMISKKLLRHISDSTSFKDGYNYYIFAEDNSESALLANCNAGNGNGIHYGKGGCKWSFAPHTAHNSYVLDIALAEEIERAVAGASVEARALAISKLRQRVREQASVDAPDWNLVQSSEVNGVNICVYNRSRPRGDLQNTKMTGKIAESPRECIRGIMNFERRRQWERMFEDGVVVEPIDIGERYPAPIFADDATVQEGNGATPNDPDDLLAGIPYAPAPSGHAPKFLNLPDTPAAPASQPAFARKTDDVVTFLQTVDLTGIPRDMAIGFLNDPERQHALSHLRKQMLESCPEDCVLCREPFHSSADYRFCPCCASICCGTCMSKRVFEVVSRQAVSVCVHCYRESSRIRQPPDVVKDESHVDENLRGKWWRPEDLGIPDYSDGLKSPENPLPTDGGAGGEVCGEDDPDRLTVDLTRKNISPFVRSLFANRDEVESDNNHGKPEAHMPSSLQNYSEGLDTADEMFDAIDEMEQNFRTTEFLEEEGTAAAAAGVGATEGNLKSDGTEVTSTNTAPPGAGTGGGGGAATEPIRTARCKKCGEVISRNVEEIEQHMDECVGLMRAREAGEVRTHSESIGGVAGAGAGAGGGPSKVLGGITRKLELEKNATRIIYHTARTHSKLFRPREVCALQDCFIDSEGVWYSYEISVRHCDVQGITGYATAEILLLLHAARPIAGNKDVCDITIISQVDSRTKAPKWLISLTEEGGGRITAPRKMDLVRELKASGNLKDILGKKGGAGGGGDGADDDAKVSLNDFELMAVLGRGGFGKVMQVRHKETDKIYAMKILKKSELQRRRQVERTKTERTILAAIQHPFIVCLHYAFQNNQKLYMVMDFVQVSLSTILSPLSLPLFSLPFPSPLLPPSLPPLASPHLSPPIILLLVPPLIPIPSLLVFVFTVGRRFLYPHEEISSSSRGLGSYLCH